MAMRACLWSFPIGTDGALVTDPADAEAILDFVRARQFADHLVQTEVVTHAGYDVTPDVFATFFGIIAETVQETCGVDWSPAMADARRRTLADLDIYVAKPERVTAWELWIPSLAMDDGARSS